jgi:hypothetical protein
MMIRREVMHYQFITTSAAKIQHKGVTLYNNQKYDDNSIWWEIYDRHIRGTSIYDEAVLIMD